MSGERDGSSERLSGFIIDSLHDAGVVGAADMQRATGIAAEEISVAKATGDYWCSWCGLRAEPSPGVQANDDSIRFSEEGIDFQLKRVRRVAPDGTIPLEIQVRGRGFSGRYPWETRIHDLLRFASMLSAAADAEGGGATATLGSAAGDVAIELQMPRGSAIGSYRFRTQEKNGVAVELSGSFVGEPASVARLAHAEVTRS